MSRTWAGPAPPTQVVHTDRLQDDRVADFGPQTVPSCTAVLGATGKLEWIGGDRITRIASHLALASSIPSEYLSEGIRTERGARFSCSLRWV
jgi:hypothetical protein